MRKFSVSFPYRLGYPIQVAIHKLGILGLVGWLYQKFSRRGLQAEDIQVSERIVEMPSVHRLLGQCTRPPATILEIGHVNSALALELASLGYRVTGIDLRRYPFTHPNLVSVQGDFLQQDWGGQQFQAVVMVSTLEHLGFNRRYGGSEEADRGLDRLALAKIGRLLTADGCFILTVPYARAECADTWFKTYTRATLVALLMQDFTICSEDYFVRQQGQWRPAADLQTDPEYPYNGVAIFCLKKK